MLLGTLSTGAAMLWALPMLVIPVSVVHQGAPAAETNIALGKPYQLWPSPDYQYCTDPGDKTQLTDGKSTKEYFWTQQGTVGWKAVDYALVTVDLGRVEPISGVAFTTAAGAAGVRWASEIRIQASDDGKSYRDLGDLIQLDQKRNGPWPETYAVRRAVTHELATHGRYVRFLPIPLSGTPYLFVDEVEVFRGPETLLALAPAGKPAKDPKVFVDENRARRSIRLRFTKDVEALRASIGSAAKLDPAVRARLHEQLDRIAKQLNPDAVPVGSDFRAVLPFDQAHARLFQLQAQLWKACGLPEFSAGAAAAWDPLELIGVPTQLDAAVQVHTMRGEYRAAAVNLVNSSDHMLQARVRFEGLPDSPAPGYVTLHEVPWTDTAQLKPVAAALPEVRPADGAWTVSIRPGMVQQLWLTFHVTDQPAGEHKGQMIIEAAGLPPQQVPVQLRIWPLDFPKQTTLYVGGWSYTDGAGSYGVTPENKAAFLEHLQARGVNAPWAKSAVMMKFAFDKNDPSKIQLDTAGFDDWLAQWPAARRRLVFLSVGSFRGTHAPTFAGVAVDSPEFPKRVAVWIHAWVAHLRTKGVAPNQLGLLIHDEPHEGTDTTALVAWAKAIRAAEPEVLIWEDPTYVAPAKAPQELFEVSSILCPNRPQWLGHAAAFEKFYGNQQKQGRCLEFYSCSGPAHLLDPYSYYRLQAWQCWKVGATGSYFWAFGDTSGASSWCEYYAKRPGYTPLYIGPKSVTAGKQMEAVRESVEDYEYFIMLRDAVQRAKAAGKTDTEFAAADKLLHSAVDEVLGAEGADNRYWHLPKDRGLADAVRVHILEQLSALK